MRVPVYQQQVTPQIPSVRSQVQVPDGATGVALQPIDTTAGITQGVESLRLGLMKMNENREKFMLASAVNEYRRANTEFLHAKDTGVFAKKGKDVFGVTQQFDEFSTKTRDNIAKQYRMNGEAKNRFLEATSSLYNSSLASVMTHEQRETDAVYYRLNLSRNRFAENRFNKQEYESSAVERGERQHVYNAEINGYQRHY